MNNITQQLKDKFKDAYLEDETHTYTVKNETYESVSYRLKNFYVPFDKSIAKWSAKKAGTTEKKILEEWKDKSTVALIKGKDVHEFAELYGKGLVRHSDADHIQKKAVVQWYSNMPDRYRPIAFEQLMYWEEEKLAGTTDLLLFDSITHSILPVDWKTNESDMFKVWNNQKLKRPFEYIFQCEFSKYELQLSYYRAMLKLAGFKTGPAMLVWLKPESDHKLYQSFLTTDHSETLIRYHNDARNSA
jgi:hypothetical protein